MARITISPAVYPSFKLKDGNYTVKMRVTCNRKSRFIITSEIARPHQLTRSLAIKDQELLNRLRKLETMMRDAVVDLDNYTLEQMDIDAIIAYMNRRLGGDFNLDFFSFWEQAVKDKPEGSRQNYMIALRNFKRFVGSETLDISRISSRLMRDYEAALTDKYGRGARAVTMYTAAVSHVHSLARKKYNDEFSEPVIKNPFEFYKPPKQKPSRHRNVSVNVIQNMIDKRNEMEGQERRAVDAYLLSFGLMGMNAPDLLSCAPPEAGIIIYNRQKTRERRNDHAEMHVKIDERIKPIYEQWKETDGKHAFIFHRTLSNHRQFNWALAKGLAIYRKRMGIPPKGLDFYSARHTWASLAYSIGIEKSIINDCLCHVDEAMKVTDIYINKDWSVLWEANRKVLDLFRWPDK